MKKVIIAPDSFKGTMESQEVCRIMAGAWKRHFSDCEIVTLPIADGGEGTVDCFLSILEGQKRSVTVKDPYMEDICGFYGIAGDVAIIEMAAAAGLDLVGENLNPFRTTTYGVGELILDAVKNGCKKIILGLGGSCTNDCGAGMAAALGTKFYDKDGKAFIPTGGNLGEVEVIDPLATRSILYGVEIVAMCDIDAPLFGKTGAAYVYGPQKGAGESDVVVLDHHLRQFAECMGNTLHIDVADMPGAGAAGGMGAGAVAFLGATLQRGIDAILDQIQFESMLMGVDYVLTGEGKLDNQSLAGKVVVGISRRAKTKQVPVIAVVGSFTGDALALRKEGVTCVVETGAGRSTLAEMKRHCRTDLQQAMEKICEELEVENQEN